MNLWNKIVKGVNPDDDEPFNDVFEDDEIYNGMSDGNIGDIGDFMSTGGYSPYNNNQSQNQNPNQGGYSQSAPPQQNYQQTSQPAAGGINISSGGNMQLSVELKIVKPLNFNDAIEIADHLMNRKTVILNLEEADKETCRRLIDFLAGVAYAIQGQLERVAERTFVITPSNITVSPEQLKEERKKNNNSDNSIY